MRSVPDYCFDSHSYHSNDHFDGEYLRNSVPVHSQVRVNNYSAGPHDDDVSCVSIAHTVNVSKHCCLHSLLPLAVSPSATAVINHFFATVVIYATNLVQHPKKASWLQYCLDHHSITISTTREFSEAKQDAAENNRHFLGSKQYSSETICDLQ